MLAEDTIAAISTPPGEGGIGIVRMSGPAAFAIGKKIFSFAGTVIEPQSHRLYYGHVIDPETGAHIDEALIAFMRAPRTYTREDVVEINCHGGIMPLAKTLQTVLTCGARLAEPGEFTQRAFLNGRIDLAQAEAVIQIIRAKSETAMKLGLKQLQGRLSREVKELRRRLLALLARVEASIDFPEHHDVEEVARAEILTQAKYCLEQTEMLLATATQGRILREGLKTAIIGLPNVGKSSLLNALLREQRAIVTAIPGTTRDVLEENINLGGVLLTVIDTAGIRATEDEVERLGVERSREALAEADLVLFVLDSSLGFRKEEGQLLAAVGEKPCIVVANKTDLLTEKEAVLEEIAAKAAPRTVVPMSLLTGEGLDLLEKTIIDTVFAGAATVGEGAMVTSIRHKNALARAKEALEELLAATEAGMEIDLLAIDLTGALEALGEITGENVSSDLLQEIFSTFCIGK
ncbi:MAG: tRNA uridine-5-carboxymethylaminomethyl(34) synthesis GTPase MnmE [Firmicutes bacterium]|nr:tRNA uridine-5-carboxymethylaminomethyl(34) synthesis GTPase MnmE [Bacillota bacterium]